MRTSLALAWALTLTSGCGRLGYDSLSSGWRDGEAPGSDGSASDAGPGGTEDGSPPSGDGSPGGTDGSRPPDAGGSDGGGTTSPRGGVCEPEPGGSCVTATLTVSPFSSGMASADNRADGDTLAGSCGGAGAPDRIYRALVTMSGRFFFSTADSDFDTVLYVLDGIDCSAPEMACNDDYRGTYHSYLELDLDSDAVVVVDGADGHCGELVIRYGPAG